jgi:hypothetical protein
MKKGGWKHSDETRAKIAAKQRSWMTDAERAKISQETKARMADPAVRRRIQDGMRAASGEAIELQTMLAAWRAARPAARKRFMAEVTNADG